MSEQDFYWNFIDPWGKEHTVQRMAKTQAYTDATEDYKDQMCEAGGLRNGERYIDEVVLIRCSHENGEEVERAKMPVSFTYYKDDADEHGLRNSDLI